MTAGLPPPWVAPGNDYRGILEREAGSWPSVAVVLTGSDDEHRAASLARDLTYQGRLAVIAARAGRLPESVREFDVVALLAADAASEDGWLDAHLRWHRRASNVVVIGPGDDPTSTGVIRGSRLLLGNDQAFAALTHSNVSFPGALWPMEAEPGPVAGWAMWNEGCFFVYEPAATVSGGEGRSDRDHALALADVIPHRRYRRQPSAFHGVPKVSWLVGVGDADQAMSAWEMCQRSTFPDHEVVLHGPLQALAPFEPVATSNARVAVIQGEQAFGDAVRASRGELVAILDGRARVAPETVSKTVARFEAKPSAPIVRVGYDIDGARYLRLDDLAAIDADLGRGGLPLFAMSTRRELMKDGRVFDDPGRAWKEVLDRDQSLVVSPLAEMSGPVSLKPATPGIAEVASIGVKEAAKEVVRTARRRRARLAHSEPQPAGDPEAIDRVSVAYVGFTGHNNLGDEAVRVAIERLMPWADFETDPIDPKLLMVGGGTLINGRRYYLNRMLRQESASVERALFGTGVRSPEYWGVTEPMDDWFSFIDSSLFAAVRGPDSVRNLRTMGYGKDLPIIGDPALYLEPPEDVARVEGRIVVCPVYTSGNLHGGSDDAVFDVLARLIQQQRAEGREVVMLSAFPQDDRWIIDIMRRALAPDLPYLPGYEDIDATMALLASADLVIGERLHAAIMAAAAGTPFVGLEYRPKMRDFARSVDQEAAIIRTDEMERLDEVCARLLSRRDVVANELENSVSTYRKLQVEAAEELHRRLLGS